MLQSSESSLSFIKYLNDVSNLFESMCEVNSNFSEYNLDLINDVLTSL